MFRIKWSIRYQLTTNTLIFRCLVKNLIVGYMSSPPTGKEQVLRVIATVLDLNKEERQKVGLEQGPNQTTQVNILILYINMKYQ